MHQQLIPNYRETPLIDVFIYDLRKYLPDDDYEPTIMEEEQAKILKKLEESTIRGKFSFVIDGITAKTKHCLGIERWLGYPDKTFSLQQYLEINHPAHGIAYWMYGSCLWDFLKVHKEIVRFYDVTAVFNLALKHANGKYLLCSCDATFFQISASGIVTEFCYEFTVLKDFDGEDFSIKFFDNTGYRNDLLVILNKAKKEKFKSIKLFSEQEMRILNRYAYNENSNSKSIAASFKIDKKTVLKHNTNILDKAETFFFKRFDSAKNFALYLKKIELI